MEGDILINGLSAAAVIYGILEAVKRVGKLNGDQAPLAAIIAGITISVAWAIVPHVTEIVVRGAAVGVLATTAYAGVRKNADGGAGSGEYLP